MKLPGSERRVQITPQRAFLIVGLLLLLLALYGLYLAYQVWDVERRAVVRHPVQAHEIITPPSQGTKPVIIFPTQPATLLTPTPDTSLPTASPTSSSGATPGIEVSGVPTPYP
ncbi:MAG: hypothetical protein M3281_09780, partial [Chloroflexota bacterium]|nr:hypothetical protein [Chloroflexota bacterium]